MTIDEFKSTTNRMERYRFAGKLLRFRAYRLMENYALASFLICITLPWAESDFVQTLIIGNVWIVAVVGVMHHFMLVIAKPWIFLTAVFMAGIVWALNAWLLNFPHVGVFCVFTFVLCYWIRGEQEVNEKAYENFRKEIEQK